MKHYIYLTEDKLITSERKGARGYSFMGSRTITGPETVTGAMESLADIYNLKGRASSWLKSLCKDPFYESSGFL